MFHVPNFAFQSVYPEDEIIEKFNIDLIDAGRAFIELVNWKMSQITDDISCLIPDYIDIEYDVDDVIYLKNKNGFIVAKKRKISLYFDSSPGPFEKMDSIPTTFNEEDLIKTVWDIPILPFNFDILDDSIFNIFVKTLENLYKKSDKAICLYIGCWLMEKPKLLRGTENFYCDIYQDENGTNRLLNKLLERYLKIIQRVINGAGKYIDIIRFADDFGTQNGPIISRKKFRDIFKPKYKEMWDFIHENSDCAVSLHSCGSVFELLPELIEAGLDILNPVQTSAKDMEPKKLKREFGKDLIFWGGCGDTQDVLVFGDSKEVEKDTRERIETLGKGGGLIFAHINNIQQDIPPKNIITMLDTINKFNNL